jgi:phosphoglucosamine mutase
MGKQLFGTDGIRGVAGEPPLDPATVFAFGMALGNWVARHGSRRDVVIGMDTRESGPWLAQNVAGGLRETGARARFAGVITTPGVAYLARTGDFVAGVMISASHNPYQDNGLKVFDHSGYKLPDDIEHDLEQEIFRLLGENRTPVADPLDLEEELDASYLDYLAANSPALGGIKIAVDCGNGAAYQLAPDLLGRAGAEVYAVACSPTGRNINLDCGALHLDHLKNHVLGAGADLGVAFDGDADRSLFVSHSGKIVNGDAVLLMCGRHLHQQGKLTGEDGEPLVVATVMSNLGLERALASSGIRMLRTPVGDKYVLEEMLRREAAVGGEQSGHVIFREHATTGDGLLTALQVLAIMRETGSDLDQLTADLEVYPQLLLNIRVKTKRPLEELPTVQEAIRDAEEAFAGTGRVLVRFSGTEPLARVMIEGADNSLVERFAERIAEAIRKELAESS